MFGGNLRCGVCNQYIPDRCTCGKHFRKLQRCIQTAGGKCAIGSDNEYEWQTVAYVNNFDDALAKAKLLDNYFTYRLKYSEDLIVLVSEGAD